MTSRFKDICIDANDHQSLADWWCRAIGYQRRDDLFPETNDDGSVWERPREWPVPIMDAHGVGPAIWIVPVPEAKSGKNRLHIDLYGDVEEMLSLGATAVTLQADAIDDHVEWDVLADPEGNEFCVFSEPESAQASVDS